MSPDFDSEQWTFSRDKSHSYLVLTKQNAQLFAIVAERLVSNGIKKRFGRSVYNYAKIGPYLYWIMPSMDGTTQILNRILDK